MTNDKIILSLTNTEVTRSLGVNLGRCLPAGSTILLEGDLGSGKTTLVQGIGAGLGISDPIQSPTFTLISEYLEGRIPLYHFDLYRLEPKEIAGLQPEIYWEGIEFPPGIVAIEWAEKLDYKPLDYLRIRLTHQGDRERIAEIYWIGNFQLNYVFTT